MRELFPSLAAARRGLWRGVRCFGRGLRKFGRAMIYVLSVLVLIHLVAVVVTGRQLQGDVERLTKAGIIVPSKDLIPTVPPGAQNAADVYQKAWDALRLSNEDESALFDPWVKHDAPWFALARRVVAANPEYYRLVDRAASMSTCVFPVNWKAGFAATFPHFSQMRRAARLLALRPYVYTAEGRADDALASIETLFRAAQQTQTDPVLIADLVSYGIQGIGVRALSDILPTGAPTPAACRSLYDQLGEIDNVRSSARTMRGEMALWGTIVWEWLRSGRMSVSDLTSTDGGQFDVGRPPRLIGRLRAWAWRPLLNMDERVYLSYMDREIRAFDLPWPRSRDTIDALQKELDTKTPFYAVVTRVVMPVFGRAVWSRDRATASDRTAQVALALKAYRYDHAVYPASLAELEAAGWKLPLDPFGSKPLHYRRQGAGFAVWSLGPDMDNDDAARDFESYNEKVKGIGPRSERPPEDYDIVFRCAR
ncbi:MAG: hypothetical protein ACE149_07725 [Armatimonadota bacterium]